MTYFKNTYQSTTSYTYSGHATHPDHTSSLYKINAPPQTGKGFGYEKMYYKSDGCC